MALPRLRARGWRTKPGAGTHRFTQHVLERKTNVDYLLSVPAE